MVSSCTVQPIDLLEGDVREPHALQRLHCGVACMQYVHSALGESISRQHGLENIPKAIVRVTWLQRHGNKMTSTAEQGCGLRAKGPGITWEVRQHAALEVLNLLDGLQARLGTCSRIR
jgi:hypothetical protein